MKYVLFIVGCVAVALLSVALVALAVVPVAEPQEPTYTQADLEGAITHPDITACMIEQVKKSRATTNND